MIESVG